LEGGRDCDPGRAVLAKAVLQAIDLTLADMQQRRGRRGEMAAFQARAKILIR
jgi:hypothetical protein